VKMSFPEIKRAPILFHNGVLKLFVCVNEIKEERLSRAKWARALAKELERLFERKKEGVTQAQIILMVESQLIQQAEADEK